jgi:hypothetical protein
MRLWPFLRPSDQTSTGSPTKLKEGSGSRSHTNTVICAVIALVANPSSRFGCNDKSKLSFDRRLCLLSWSSLPGGSPLCGGVQISHREWLKAFDTHLGNSRYKHERFDERLSKPVFSRDTLAIGMCHQTVTVQRLVAIRVVLDSGSIQSDPRENPGCHLDETI